MPRGHFDFARDPIAFFHTGGTTNGTTSQQVVGAAQALLATGGGIATGVCRVEPKEAVDFGHPLLDQLTRAVIMAGRATGSGTWSCVFEMSRNGGTNWDALPRMNLNIPSYTSALPFAVVEQPLPANLLRTFAQAANDTIIMRALVTPGQAIASVVSMSVLLVPGFAAAQASRGRFFT